MFVDFNVSVSGVSDGHKVCTTFTNHVWENCSRDGDLLGSTKGRRGERGREGDRER